VPVEKADLKTAKKNSQKTKTKERGRTGA